jgi:hypothetical protein
LNHSAYTAAVSVNLQTAKASGVGGTFVGIQSVTGGSGNNTLEGMNGASVWNVSGMNAGRVTASATVAFTGFQKSPGRHGKEYVYVRRYGWHFGQPGRRQRPEYAGLFRFQQHGDCGFADRDGEGCGRPHQPYPKRRGRNGGGAGVYNVLVGNGGNVLTGGNGRCNLLIAGSSASTLHGGDDDDILIGGRTAYDRDVASLMAIMDYRETIL